MSSGWAGRPVLPTPEVALLTGPWILPNATLAALPVTLVARPSNSPLWFPYSTRPCDWSRRPLLCWLQPASRPTAPPTTPLTPGASNRPNATAPSSFVVLDLCGWAVFVHQCKAGRVWAPPRRGQQLGLDWRGCVGQQELGETL